MDHRELPLHHERDVDDLGDGLQLWRPQEAAQTGPSALVVDHGYVSNLFKNCNCGNTTGFCTVWTCLAQQQ